LNLFIEGSKGAVLGLKDRLKRGLRKFLPVAASVLAGVVAGPAASVVTSFVSSQLGKIGIRVDESELYSFSKGVIKGAGIDVLKEELISILRKEKKLTKEDIQSAVDYVIRPLFARLNESLELLKSNRELLVEQLQELGIETRDIKKRIGSIEVLQNKILDELKEQRSTLNRLFSQLISKFGFRESKNLIMSSKVWSQNCIIASAYDYSGIFDEDLYVDRGSWPLFREFLESDYPIYLLLAHAGMGKTWELASLSYRLQDLGHPAYFISLRRGLNESFEAIFGTKNLSEIGKLINKYYSSEKKSTQKEIFLILDGLDEVYDEVERSNILGKIDMLLKETRGVKIVLGCRLYDWMESRGIRANREIIQERTFGSELSELGIKASQILNRFTDRELDIAIDNYGLENFPSELRGIARNPFAFRIIAEHYVTQGRYIEVDEMFIVKVLERMGFDPITLSYFNILVDEILRSGGMIELSTMLREIKVNERSFSNIMSSGLLVLKKRGLGVTIKIQDSWRTYIERIKRGKEEEKVKKISPEKPKRPPKGLVLEIKGKKFEIDGIEVVIGRNLITRRIEIRSPTSGTIDTGIKEPFISANHLKVYVKSNEIYVEDLDSTNKTFIGDKELEPRKPMKVAQNQIINLAKKVNLKITLKQQKDS